MRNFNTNLLGAVQGSIGKQQYQVMQYEGRRKVDSYWVSSFGTPIDMRGSVQPANAKNYKDLGLDFKKTYIKIYDTKLINTLTRNTNPDQIIYNGYVWTIATDTAWSLAGGWNFVLCVMGDKYKEES